MRKAGVLMPVSALPSRIGAGELGESAFQFIELLKENHVKIWQILPLNPVGYGNSPYQPYSSCAGDELYISLDALAEEGLLKEHPKEFQERATRVDYEAVRQYREPFLRFAFDVFTEKKGQEETAYKEFISQEKQQKYTALFRRQLSAKITPRVICPARLAFNNKKNDKRHCSCGKKSDKGQNDGQSEIHFIYDA